MTLCDICSKRTPDLPKRYPDPEKSKDMYSSELWIGGEWVLCDECHDLVIKFALELSRIWLVHNEKTRREMQSIMTEEIRKIKANGERPPT